MGLRGCWRWLLVLALVYGPGFGGAEDGDQVRHRRQSHWWQTHQRQAPAHGSAPGGSRQVPPAVGFGSRAGLNQPIWGSRDRWAAGPSRQLQLPAPPSSPIRVECGEDVMVVIVDRDLFGNGKLVKVSDLLLGPGPDPCKPDPSQTEMAVFQSPLQDCGNTAEMFQDWVVYSTILKYNPTATAGIPISRTNAAIVPIQCFYPRHGNVSSKAIKPTWAPFSTTVSSSEKLAFNLQLMTSDWRDISPPFFKLGDIMYLQASVDIRNHAPMFIFVDSCVATTTPDENSDPRYEIIADNGCLMDGMQDDASSAFISPRVQPNELQFTVDAFIFLNLDISEIFITCNLRAVPVTQVPDDLNKACSFSKSSNSWSAVEGPSNICQCCATKTCVTPASRSGQSRGWGSSFGRRVGRVRREAADDEQQMVSTLGPLTVVRPHSSLGLKKAEQTDVVEFWALAAVGGVSLVFVAVCAVLIGKTLAKPKQLVFTVEK